MSIYKYRNLPCTASPDDWCIFGTDSFYNSVGVLEWCVDEKDAILLFQQMKEYPQFKGICVCRFNQPDSIVMGLC